MSFQLSRFLEHRSTIATKERNPDCSGMVVRSVAQIWSAALSCLRCTRQGNRSVSCSARWCGVFGQSHVKPWRRIRLRTRSRLIAMPSLARSSTIRRLPLHGSSRSRASILAVMRSVNSRTGVSRSSGVDRGKPSCAHWRLILGSGWSGSTSLGSSWALEQLRFFSAAPIPCGACRFIGTTQLP